MQLKMEIQNNIEREKQFFEEIRRKNLCIDMTRGRPSAEQLRFAMPMLEHAGECDFCSGNADARNYGELAGLLRARELFANVFGVSVEETVVGDGSSLNMMYDLVQFAMQFGVLGGTPWNKLDKVKFLCPAPGYDRHFFICEQFGIEMITVPMFADGPDMDMIERLVENDDSIKGVWCVPKYSNPMGIVYSNDVVERFAKLKPKAKDFRIFWDNAYALHFLYEDDTLQDVFATAKKYSNEDMIYQFTSTSKITFAGSGVAVLSASKRNIDDLLKRYSYKIINPNKVNQAMHADFLKDADNIKNIMRAHANVLRPKFELFDKKMSQAFGDCEEVRWTKPRGGYFISLDVKGCAKRIVELAGHVGVKFTNAGATFPYGKDKENSNIRIAPSVPSIDELDVAIDVLIHAIKLALAEREYAQCE